MLKNFHAELDPEHGGRWASLIDPTGKQWLWQHPDPAARDTVVPGQSFVDVGGIEECFPTIGGHPDHGDIWTRPWQEHEDGLTVITGDFQLFRRLSVGTSITADYQLVGPPGPSSSGPSMHCWSRPKEPASRRNPDAAERGPGTA